MKPFPKYDFPVSVTKQIWEEEPKTAHLYRNIFSVRLNFTFNIMFIPTMVQIFQSEELPPLIDYVENISTEFEARFESAIVSRYIVTPYEEFAGKEIVLKHHLLENPKENIFFLVTSKEFAVFVSELSDFAEERPFVYDSYPVSTVKNCAFVNLILSRIIPSKHFLKEDLYILGRGELNQ